jgi:MoaA/NifB/PqqE/SkfB family radical SAM enzyme
MTITAEPKMTDLLLDNEMDVIDNNNSKYTSLLDKSLKIFFMNAFKICARNPGQAYAFLNTFLQQRKAARVRADYAKQGIHVPPMMIFSVTSRCNLRCKGCYHWSLRPQQNEELSAAKLKSIIAEASELGISFIILAGGEPLVRPEVMEITAAYPNIQFLIFTNGTMIDDKAIATLEKQRNDIPAISLEGNRLETDERRGNGIYARLENIVKKMRKKNIFWGTSLTVTRMNFVMLTDEKFIRSLYQLGCRLFFFAEYTPVTPGTEEWVISNEQRAELSHKVATFREKFSALFVSVPGDEDEFGGCLAAGRGFIHVSAEGNVEPCPFVPYSDASLKDIPLKEALRSNLLKQIRDNSGELAEGPGGCALWDKKDWLNSILAK